jgi:hypothetical protein
MIVTVLRSFPGRHLELVATEEELERAVIGTAEGTVSFSSMRQRAPGDEFSRMVLGMHNFFRTMATRKARRRRRILDLLDECEMAVGVVAAPDFTATDSRLDLVFAIAAQLDGMVFNGSGMIDSRPPSRPPPSGSGHGAGREERVHLGFAEPQ